MDQNYNPYEPQVDPNWNPQPEKPEKMRTGFGKGLACGLVIGIAIAIASTFIGLKVYTKKTGNLVVIGDGSVTKVENDSLIDDQTAAMIDELRSDIELYYTGDIDDDVLRDGILHGLVSSLGDIYTEYYNPQEYNDYQVSVTGNYAGIGAGLTQDTETMKVTITKVYEGTPSEDVGLLKDDIIVSVDGTDSTTKELSDLVQMMRGEEGTNVTLEIYRPSTGKTFEVEITRRVIELPSVEYNMLPNNIGYIQVTQFQTNTAEQFNAAIADLESQGMEKMIIDLRDNPGGLLGTVTDMLDTVLPEGTTVYTEDKYGNRHDFTSDSSCLNYPMVVLINGNSASASEIFAGAIKDYEYGTLIGTNTFGKGIVQSIIDLSNGGGLKITSANYYTPNGNFIHGKGIAPDIELEYEFQGPEGASYSQEYDNQLIYAQEYLNGKR